MYNNKKKSTEIVCKNLINSEMKKIFNLKMIPEIVKSMRFSGYKRIHKE